MYFLPMCMAGKLYTMIKACKRSKNVAVEIDMMCLMPREQEEAL